MVKNDEIKQNKLKRKGTHRNENDQKRTQKKKHMNETKDSKKEKEKKNTNQKYFLFFLVLLFCWIK